MPTPAATRAAGPWSRTPWCRSRTRPGRGRGARAGAVRRGRRGGRVRGGGAGGGGAGGGGGGGGVVGLVVVGLVVVGLVASTTAAGSLTGRPTPWRDGAFPGCVPTAQAVRHQAGSGKKSPGPLDRDPHAVPRRRRRARRAHQEAGSGPRAVQDDRNGGVVTVEGDALDLPGCPCPCSPGCRRLFGSQGQHTAGAGRGFPCRLPGSAVTSPSTVCAQVPSNWARSSTSCHDEARDPEVHRPGVDLLRGGGMLSTPSSMTATVSAIESASSWSWVTETAVAPVRQRGAHVAAQRPPRPASAPRRAREQDEPGVRGERAGQRDPLLLPARQPRRGAAGVAGQSYEFLEHLGNAPGAAALVARQPEGDIARDVEVREERSLLGDERDAVVRVGPRCRGRRGPRCRR